MLHVFFKREHTAFLEEYCSFHVILKEAWNVQCSSKEYCTLHV